MVRPIGRSFLNAEVKDLGLIREKSSESYLPQMWDDGIGNKGGISMSRTIHSVKPYFPPEDIEEVKEVVGKVLQSGMLTNYTYTRNFEKQFAELCNVRHAVAVNSVSYTHLTLPTNREV